VQYYPKLAGDGMPFVKKPLDPDFGRRSPSCQAEIDRLVAGDHGADEVPPRSSRRGHKAKSNTDQSLDFGPAYDDEHDVTASDLPKQKIQTNTGQSLIEAYGGPNSRRGTTYQTTPAPSKHAPDNRRMSMVDGAPRTSPPPPDAEPFLGQNTNPTSAPPPSYDPRELHDDEDYRHGNFRLPPILQP